MTGAPNNARTVVYNIDKNWAANTASWATKYPASTNLAPLLINKTPSLAQAAREGVMMLGALTAEQSQEPEMAEAINVPDGAYTNVTVTPITGKGGFLSKGDGTMGNNTFSCGNFPADDRPSIGDKSTIIATHSVTKKLYQFPGDCTHSGPTSDYQ